MSRKTILCFLRFFLLSKKYIAFLIFFCYTIWAIKYGDVPKWLKGLVSKTGRRLNKSRVGSNPTISVESKPAVILRLLAFLFVILNNS